MLKPLELDCSANPSSRAARVEKVDRKVSIAGDNSLRSNCEVLIMSQETAHVKLRCMECKAKFDSKYDAFDTSGITNVGQILQNFIFCQKMGKRGCGKRVSVVVVDIR